MPSVHQVDTIWELNAFLKMSEQPEITSSPADADDDSEASDLEMMCTNDSDLSDIDSSDGASGPPSDSESNSFKYSLNFESYDAATASTSYNDPIWIETCSSLADFDPSTNQVWQNVTGIHLRSHLVFSGNSGITEHCNNLLGDRKPCASDFFKLVFDDEMVDVIVEETNRYAVQTLSKALISRSSRMHKWSATTNTEIKAFFGLVMYMGIVKYPKISDYWRKDILFVNKFVKQVMSRNRFQLLLRFLHFSNDQEAPPGDRLHKISKVLSMIECKYKNLRVPGKNIVIGAAVIPWRGRLNFQESTQNKPHQCGIKVFKLCDPKGYTYSFSVYVDRSSIVSANKTLTEVVLDLSSNYQNAGRLLAVDNFHTSFDMAYKLLQLDTHLLGTIPKDVVDAKLKHGDIVGLEHPSGIVVAKWKGRKDVCMLSTQHTLEMVEISHARAPEKKMKPRMVIDYNAVKQGIDLSTQMASYFSPLRRSIKWYHRVMFETILSTSVVNALVLYKEVTKEACMEMATFREQIVKSLVPMPLTNTNSQSSNSDKHVLVENKNRDASNRKLRKRCNSCYEMISKEKGPGIARKQAKRVATYCDTCDEKPAMCLECFIKHQQ